MKIYVEAKSKKHVNDMLASGQQVLGYNHSIYGGAGTGWYNVSDLADGDVVAIFQKTINGNPVVKSWGCYVKDKNTLK
jgi:hypothetical protein